MQYMYTEIYIFQDIKQKHEVLFNHAQRNDISAYHMHKIYFHMQILITEEFA